MAWRALRLIDPYAGPSGGTKLANGDDLARMGRVVARQFQYICRGAGCAVPMIPVFSESVGERLQAHVGHFRALTGHPHIESCPERSASDPARVVTKVSDAKMRDVQSTARPDVPLCVSRYTTAQAVHEHRGYS